MATPTRKGKYGADSPTHSSVPANGDATQAVNVHIVLRGTAANIAADWATLMALNFASPSALASWERG